MNTTRWLATWSLLVGGVITAAALAPSGAQATPAEDERVALAADSGEQLPAIVVMRSQALLHAHPALTRAQRLHRAENVLRSTADTGQRSLLEALAKDEARGNVSDVVPLWITNAVSLRATAAVLAKIARRPDVARVDTDRIIAAPEPSETQAEVTAVEPNVARVNAPAMWDLGHRGQGVVVASMDTGVDATHPDLAARWRGGTNSWYDPYGEHPLTPTDVNGHGTQTMGVIVGGDAGGTAIGVAPDARWISVKIFNDHGAATSTAIHLGFQWLLDPDHDPSTADAPRVVNNSWTMSGGGCVLDFQQDVRNLRAVGILSVFAAGNYGPTTGSVPSPANYPEALSVGGTDEADVLDPYSGRGPSACAGAMSPTLTAPDLSIRTSDLYASYVEDTGTSVAAPQVTGALALLLSAVPGLAGSADAQQAALTNGAHDLGAPGVDNDTGFGRLDVLAAYQWADTSSDFTVGVTPASVGTVQGDSAALAVDVAAVGDFAGDVTLSAAGLPAGATASFVPAVIAGGAGTSQLTITTNASLAPGTYPFSVAGTSGATTHTAVVTLVITTPPDFTLVAAPASRTVSAGAGTTYSVTVGSLNAFTGVVGLSVSGLPIGVGTAQLSPSSISAAGSSTLSVSTVPGAPGGTYSLRVTGTSGAMIHVADVTLVVPVADFSLATTPSALTITRGRSAIFTVAVARTGGFTGTVAMSVTGAPSGSTVSWTSRNVVPPGTTKLTVKTTGSTIRKTYSLVLTGTSGTLRHQTPVTLTVK